MLIVVSVVVFVVVVVDVGVAIAVVDGVIPHILRMGLLLFIHRLQTSAAPSSADSRLVPRTHTRPGPSLE